MPSNAHVKEQELSLCEKMGIEKYAALLQTHLAKLRSTNIPKHSQRKTLRQRIEIGEFILIAAKIKKAKGIENGKEES